MLTPGRALTLNADNGRPLPRVPDLDALYAGGCTPRQGEVIMILGRSGTQKSGFALWLTDQWDLPTLYFSADMSAFTASSRVACSRAGLMTEEVEAIMATDSRERAELLEILQGSKTQFSFGSPISWRAVDQELDAYVELNDAFPQVIVFDNLMDFQGAESDYKPQMEIMQLSTELARDTGSTIVILHHASDKGWDAEKFPYVPPHRKDAKNGLAEKPELVLGVALDPNTYEYHIACLKQRMGKSDPTGRNYSTIICDPARTRFHKVGAFAH